MKELKNQKIKNYFLYFFGVVNKMTLITITISTMYNLNVFFDTISNERNKNWSKDLREKYLSWLTSTSYFSSVFGTIFSTFLVRFNTKTVLSVAGIVNGLSYGFLIFGGIELMIVGRAIAGFSFEVTHIVGLWSIYEIALPKHKGYFYTVLFAFFGICYGLNNWAATYDPGDDIFWKKCYAMVPVLAIILITFDTLFVPHINTFSYLIRNFSEEEVLERVSHYYEEETAKELVAYYKEKVDREVKMREKGIFKQIILNRKRIMHIVLIGMCVILSMAESLFQFGILYLSKNLEDKPEVEEAKKFINFSSIFYILGGTIETILNTGRRRKRLLVRNHILSLLTFALITFSYFKKDLMIARYAMFLGMLASGGLFGSYFYYSNDVLPPTLVFICTAALRFTSTVQALIIPEFVDFEKSDFNNISLRMCVFLAIGVCSLMWIMYSMKSTELPSKEGEKGVNGSDYEKMEDEDDQHNEIKLDIGEN